MATLTIYSLSSQEDDKNYTVAITGNVKKQVISKIDGAVGEESSPVSPIKKTIKTEDKVKARFETVLLGLQHMVKLQATAGDRCFYWGIDKDVIELINTNSPLSLINKMKSMGVDENEAPAIVQKIYDIKIKLGVRLGFQDPTKRNRFVDTAKQMLAMESAPDVPEFEEAMSRARAQANKSVQKQELEQLSTQLEQEDV